LAAAALPHSPWLRATVAVVMPQNGQGTPVSVRSGHGRPGQPVGHDSRVHRANTRGADGEHGDVLGHRVAPPEYDHVPSRP
jgi:hypothetical protein